MGVKRPRPKRIPRLCILWTENIITDNMETDDNKIVNMNLRSGINSIFNIKTVLVREPSNEVPLAI